MVKGFAASHVGDYNTATGIQYSVGEYWDGVGNIKNWINNTGKKSGAFDFPFHYNMTNAIKYNDWRKLNDASLMSDPSYRQYAVTFVETTISRYVKTRATIQTLSLQHIFLLPTHSLLPCLVRLVSSSLTGEHTSMS